MALTPSYAAIGIAAPILIAFARLLQGFSVGGEFGSSVAFLMEHWSHAAASPQAGSSRLPV
jgi:MHS family proline/betaine transporter-like MFS transporter